MRIEDDQRRLIELDRLVRQGKIRRGDAEREKSTIKNRIHYYMVRMTGKGL